MRKRVKKNRVRKKERDSKRLREKESEMQEKASAGKRGWKRNWGGTRTQKQKRQIIRQKECVCGGE